MFGISNEVLEDIKRRYPVGARVRLVHMDDHQAPQKGALGTVTKVDDIGTIHVSWDNGSSLGVLYGEDLCEVVKGG